ncbi:MAG: 4-alpha-glucanotransferase [Aggregatilineales bacterium]
MNVSRSSGILLHPTSLPGRYGIGDLGEWAYRFVDYLREAGQSIWQVLPLGPTSYGDSPYQCLSAFAGNPLLISLDQLVTEGWLTDEELRDAPNFPANRVDYGPVIDYHRTLLDRAFSRFDETASAETRAEFTSWCELNKDWLEDFALFAALKDHHGGRPWVEWPQGEALRDAQTLVEVAAQHARKINGFRFQQWLFYRQWFALKTYANDRGIRLFGDIPIFVAHDSSDVWANRDLFFLDVQGHPTVVAGVPPDYFSETGQRWGNPLYNWERLADDGYAWWIRRIKQTLETVDVVRIDHFRGFEAYWEVPASEPTAVQGRWVKGPGMAFFSVILDTLGSLPIIAEDLGVITPEVEALRDGLGLPGMKILQFAWGEPHGKDPFLPHNYVPNCVVYTGTHDNNTTIGWYHEEATPAMKTYLNQYLDREVREINWDLIRLGMASVAHTFVVPMQDVLSLNSDQRMNLPGREAGNWSYRCLPADLENSAARDRLAFYTRIYARLPADWS